jgi:hypothetical protein
MLSNETEPKLEALRLRMKSTFGLGFESIVFSARTNSYGFSSDEATCRVFLLSLLNLGSESADIVDWSDDPDFPKNGNFEVLVSVADLEAVVARGTL